MGRLERAPKLASHAGAIDREGVGEPLTKRRGGARALVSETPGDRERGHLRSRGIGLRRGGPQPAQPERPLGLGQVLDDGAFPVPTAALHERLATEDRAERGAERRAAIDDEEEASGRIEAAVAQVGDEVSHDDLILGRALDEPERHLDAVGPHAEGAGEQVRAHPKPSRNTGRKRCPPRGRASSSDRRSAVAARKRRETADREVPLAWAPMAVPTGSRPAR